VLDEVYEKNHMIQTTKIEGEEIKTKKQKKRPARKDSPHKEY